MQRPDIGEGQRRRQAHALAQSNSEQLSMGAARRQRGRRREHKERRRHQHTLHNRSPTRRPQMRSHPDAVAPSKAVHRLRMTIMNAAHQRPPHPAESMAGRNRNERAPSSLQKDNTLDTDQRGPAAAPRKTSRAQQMNRPAVNGACGAPIAKGPRTGLAGFGLAFVRPIRAAAPARRTETGFPRRFFGCHALPSRRGLPPT